jgi:tetratricopeptide (TPR) repeat protein
MGIALVLLKGRDDEALCTFRRAQDLIEPLATADSQSFSRRHELGLILQNIARLERDRGQLEKAITSIERSLAIEAQLLIENPHALDSQISTAKAHGMLAQILISQPDGLEPASAACQKAVELLESVTNEHPDLADQSNELAVLLGDLSSIQQVAGKLDSALATAQKALAIFERLDRQYPGLLKYQGGLGSAYNMMSDLHRLRREPAESLAFAQNARSLLHRLVSEHPDDVHSREDLAKSYNNIGRILQQTGEPVEALRSFQRAVDLYESIPDLDPRNNYNLVSNLALCIPLIGTKNGSQGSLDALNLSKGDQHHRQVYSDRAVEVLHRALSSGFPNAELLRFDTDIDSIRDRPDVQALIKDVEGSSPAARK